MAITWLEKGQTGFYGKAMTIGLIQSHPDHANAHSHGLLLVDSGLEGAFAKKMMKAYVEDANLSVGDSEMLNMAVLNTHSHADHIGGNGWLQRTYNAEVHASAIELPYIEHPALEGHYLYSAESLETMKTKFFCAEPSRGVNGHLINQRMEPFQWQGRQLQLLDLKGHSPGMIGVMEESGFVFLGDTLFTQDIIEKHKLLFVHNVLEWLASLSFLETLPANGYVLSHGGFYETVDDLITLTRKSLLTTQEQIYDLLKSPKEEGQIHQALAEALALTESVPGYYLNHSAIRAHLSALMSNKQIVAEVTKGLLTYCAI